MNTGGRENPAHQIEGTLMAQQAVHQALGRLQGVAQQNPAMYQQAFQQERQRLMPMLQKASPEMAAKLPDQLAPDQVGPLMGQLEQSIQQVAQARQQMAAPQGQQPQGQPQQAGPQQAPAGPQQPPGMSAQQQQPGPQGMSAAPTAVQQAIGRDASGMPVERDERRTGGAPEPAWSQQDTDEAFMSMKKNLRNLPADFQKGLGALLK